MISRTAEPITPARDPALDVERSMASTAPAPLRLAPAELRPLQQLSTARALAAAIVGGLVYAGYGLAFLSLWVVPLLVVYQVILRARGVLEHAAVPDKHDPLRNARTVVSSNPLAQFFLNPHHIGYHLEHHLYPGVPHYHLPRLHAALAAIGRFGDALVERRYTDSFADIAGPA